MGDRCHFAHGDEELRSVTDVLLHLPSNVEYRLSLRYRRNLLSKSTQPFKSHPSKTDIIKEDNNINLNKLITTISLLRTMEWATHPQTTSKQSSANFMIMVSLLFITYLGKTCPYGTKCTFAHGDEELREAPI